THLVVPMVPHGSIRPVRRIRLTSPDAPATGRQERQETRRKTGKDIRLCRMGQRNGGDTEPIPEICFYPVGNQKRPSEYRRKHAPERYSLFRCKKRENKRNHTLQRR